jgi:lipopolysaccharide/colanic/teichoic acid biosynthesis glycosyltransferase
MLLAIIAIKLEDGRRADVFYWQERVGIKGRRFRIYKFRSMRSDAEKDGARMAIANDFRVTAVGKILRKYRIDELPQLLNVFKGEMRFVGPRPERPVFVKDLINKYQYFDERHNVMPGLTGWAQIKYPYGSNLRDSFEKLKFDMYYIKHQSILFDVEILCRTVDLVLFGRGQ